MKWSYFMSYHEVLLGAFRSNYTRKPYQDQTTGYLLQHNLGYQSGLATYSKCHTCTMSVTTASITGRNRGTRSNSPHFYYCKFVCSRWSVTVTQSATGKTSALKEKYEYCSIFMLFNLMLSKSHLLCSVTIRQVPEPTTFKINNRSLP
jgi:hypothetical protein